MLERLDHRPFDPKQRFAAVVARMDAGNLHAGIAFEVGDDGDVGWLHLAWQDMLESGWEFGGVYATPLAPPEKLRAAAWVCGRVLGLYGGGRKIPYGLRFCGSTFDAQGQLVLGPDSRGLTCATVVLAILAYAEIALVDGSSWPIRTAEDRKFLRFIEPFANPDHLEVLRREVEEGVKRIWPDEVVGACASSPLPVGFDVARAAADQVVELLKH